MGAGLLIAGAALAAPLQAPDTLFYSSDAARELIVRAGARHRVQDTTVHDYQARLRYRLSFGLGRRKWARAPTVAAEEQEALVLWERPNHLRVEVVGQRSRSRNPEMQLTSGFDRPWFVPRGLSDSIRIFGGEFPERPAIHPLAAGGPDWYRYTTGDTVTLTTARGATIRLVQVEVVPRRPGPSLVAGQLWLDLATADVVRFAFRYVGAEPWVAPERPTRNDSSDARRANRIISRVLELSADLEYALQDGRYWMPYRQVLSGRVQIPLVGDVFIPFEATTTFTDHEVNTGQRPVFTLELPDSASGRTRVSRRERRDSLRTDLRDSSVARVYAGRLPGGGRYEIRRAPRDSLRAYRGWGDSLELQLTAEDDRRLRETTKDLADLVERLSPELSGRRVSGISYERLADVFRFNRVQGTSLGLGYQFGLGIPYTSVYTTARIGLADLRPTARAALVRDAPGGRLTIAAYRDLADQDAFAAGLTPGNSVRGLVSARDEGDYHLASGAALRFETSLAAGVDLGLGLRGEHHRSVAAEASAWLHDVFGGDGVLPSNPLVEEGWFAVPSARLEGQAGRTRWSLTADGLSDFGDRVTGRVQAQLRQPVGSGAGMTVRLQGGLATRPTLPQMLYRAGGQASARGFDYGVQRGDAFWSVQTDWSFRGRRALRPVVFLDAAQAGRLDGLSGERVLLGGGVGVSILNGLLRFDLSHPIAPDRLGGLHLDIVFGAPR